MADPQQVLAQRVRHALAAAFGPEHAGDDPVIRPSQFADYQSNVALPLGKQLGRPPREVATELTRYLDVADVCTEPQVSGPGFINLTLRNDWIAGQASDQLGDERLGIAEAQPTQKIVVDYSGPNVAKELHVGHLRATVVGDAIVRILEHLGHEVVRAAHLGDWGTPFGMLIEHA
ncbi:MAG: arginine--tRNA ligase, partial [Streptosporangiaceae bacterium]